MSTGIWKGFKAGDGFFADLQRKGDVEAKLVFGLKINDKIIRERVLARSRFPSAQQVGELRRQSIFWEGVAEYLNAGGELNDVSHQIASISSKFEDVKLCFPGWLYFDTAISNGNRVHEFIRENRDNSENTFVRWVRNEFVDVGLKEDEMVDDYEYESTVAETDNDD